MPIFGDTSSPFDELIEKATAETQTLENWGLILEICDLVSTQDSKGAKQCLLSIKKRLNNRDPHVIMLALSVLDSLWNNCGPTFQREVSSKEFTSELLSKAINSNRSIAEKTRIMIKNWAVNECTKDPSLGLVESLYSQLIKDGYSFEASESKTTIQISTDPNVVTSDKEEAAIAKAIALSLKDTDTESKPSKTSLYPLPSSSSLRTVVAIYDFEAVEDNELTFFAGDVISVLDDSDVNWWKGRSHRGDGLFPASFVSTEEIVGPKRKIVQFDDDIQQVDSETVQQSRPEPRIDQDILRTCLDTLRDADPTGEHPDPSELPSLEEQSLAQLPLINADLAEVDRRQNILAEVDMRIRDVLALCDSAMQEESAQFQQQFPVNSPNYAYQTTQGYYDPTSTAQ